MITPKEFLKSDKVKYNYTNGFTEKEWKAIRNWMNEYAEYKISEVQSTTELPNKEKTKVLGLSDTVSNDLERNIPTCPVCGSNGFRWGECVNCGWDTFK